MLQIFKYQESPIQFEEVDGKLMANATLMCKPFGRRPVDWLRTDQAKRYVDALSEVHKCTSTDLVNVKKGGMEQGTWIHEKLILPLARFLSVDFEIWCDERIAELMRNGATSVDGKLGKVMDAISAMANSFVSFNERLSNLEYGKKVKPEPAPKNHSAGIIDARHRTYQTVEMYEGQVRCIKIEDKTYFLMADVLLIRGCRTAASQYANTLNRSGKNMAVKIWLFGHPREAWFVNQEAVDLLFNYNN